MASNGIVDDSCFDFERLRLAGQRPMVDRHRAAPGSNFILLRHLKHIICPDAKRYHRGKGETLQSVQSIAALASSMLDAKQPRVQPPR
jgi:hypothetical protein